MAAHAPILMLDLSRQFAVLRDEILAAIAEVCDSQQFILGPQVASFESAAAKACSTRYAIGCGSGTDALWLAMVAAGIGPGHTVITSSFSFFATVSSILRCGASVLLADIDPLTYNLSPEATEQAISRNAGKAHIRAIMPVHLYGQCADMDAFNVLKRQHDLLAVEDAAQAFGGSWRGVPVGALGDAAAFSFYPTKNLSAMGDAGLVTTFSADIDDRCRSLRAHGMRQRYYHEELGWNSRLDSLQAAILTIKLRHLSTWNALRREVAARYDELLLETGLVVSSDDARCQQKTAGLVLPFTDSRGIHVFHQYVIRAPRRDQLREHLSSRGIASEIYYPLPLHQQRALKDLGYRTGDLPVSETAAAEVLALPIYPELRPDEQERVVEAIQSFYA